MPHAAGISVGVCIYTYIHVHMLSSSCEILIELRVQRK